MRTTFFNAVTAGTKIGDGTVGDQVDWIERLINVLFPENGIEYWSDNKYESPNSLKRFQPMPSADDVHHVISYVRPGGCEGRIIDVGFYLRDDSVRFITWAKTFGKEDECWMIARAISEALNSIIFWNEIPEMVALSDKVPRAQRWHRESSLREEVTIASTMTNLVISTASGQILDARDWAEEGANAKFHVESYAKDWKTVLTNTKVGFREISERQAVFPHLPGYLFTDKGVEGIKGVYVLPPGGRYLFDCDWLGYFPCIDSAVKAAEAHQAAQPLRQAA